MDGLLNIGYDEFMSMKIRVPSTEEQFEIAGILAKLDHLITTQQRKLETLKRLKQFMLQNLFV
jgi:type I restriction enzyme S subunit